MAMVRFASAKCLSIVLSSTILASGCGSIGPHTVSRDRFDYVIAISNSVKRQTLLNIVKTRYMDAPVYMDISSVISQYSLEGQLGFELGPSNPDNNLLLGNGRFEDRPTITYRPLSGQQYSRGLLKPLALSSIVLLLQSGYPADTILELCVQSINGLTNRQSGAFSARQADPRFIELVKLLRELQQTGNIYFRQDVGDKKAVIKFVFKRTKDAATRQQQVKAKRLLGLDEKVDQFDIIFGGQSENRHEIAIFSRSLTQIMTEFAADIDVPRQDLDEGRVMPAAGELNRQHQKQLSLITVKQGPEQPQDAFVSVTYRQNWYWISDSDIYSKASFNFLMILFSLSARSEGKDGTPIVTVPTY
jgi:hypothetical protein